ncbi:alanine racemase [Candidatus Symbiobacter mobilis]|uniref:Alanine racemase n=1 Tax=Candidatus Symbiobacter mobilis CR TaxID=946483 RepID=U5NCR4_9BURK|nr:alanine racemase [Candidatus Symbiobacter mobilis]AGX87954.1 alanine racemase [Candidatus Symbiobacter mobilis CR]
MPRPISATIHHAALRHNLLRCRSAAPDSKVWAVIKANAYGHGIERVHEALRGADGFALLDLDEAQRVRGLGWRGPILLIEGVFEPRDLELCCELRLWHTIHCHAQIDMLAAHKTRTAHHVFLKMNSGMNRLGFPANQFRAAWARLHALTQVGEISLMTHFSDADVPGGTQRQRSTFDVAACDLPGERSLDNSAAMLAGDLAPSCEWVRPGILLYGSAPDYPAHTIADHALLPTMTLASRVIAVQDLVAGDTVGYGSTFVAQAPMRIGIVACGYADGYPRHAPTDTPVLVGGHRTRLLGRVSMDMLAVDLTALREEGHDAGMGSEVVLWGCASNGAILGIDEVAHAAGTVGYELMCALSLRVPVRVDA